MMRVQSALSQARDSTLVVLDVQTRASAGMPEREVAAVYRAITRTLRAARVAAVPIVYTEQTEPALGVTDPRVASALPDSAYAVHKTTHNAWAEDTFANALEIAARRQIVVCGLQAHVGVVQTAIDLAGNGYQVFVLEDGTCSRDPLLARNAFARLRAAAVTVTNSESLVYEWMSDSDETLREQLLAILQDG